MTWKRAETLALLGTLVYVLVSIGNWIATPQTIEELLTAVQFRPTQGNR